jgi:nucleotide-binding universal stress UspA family protein
MSQTMNENLKGMEGCVMLAISTFRRSEAAVKIALEKSLESKKLVVVYVVDVNVARYLLDVDEEFIMGLKQSCESDLMEEWKKEAEEHVREIAKKAEALGVCAKTHYEVGRFAVICLDIAGRVRPSLIVTTRSRRAEWVKKFFGAPVDELIAQAGCPVIPL